MDKFNEKLKRIVLFIDLLGFKVAVRENDRLEELIELIKDFVSLQSNARTETFENKDHENPSFKMYPAITAFSDSLVISYPLPLPIPQIDTITSIRILVSHIQNYAAWIALSALRKGFLIRGGVAVGNLYHQDGVIVGPALIDAYKLESEKAKMPRILLGGDWIFSCNFHNTPQIFKEGQLPIALPELRPVLQETEDGQLFYSIKYIKDILSIGIPHGETYWSGVKARISEISNIVVSNIKCLSETIEKNTEKTKIERLEKAKNKWLWFQEQFETESKIIKDMMFH